MAAGASVLGSQNKYYLWVVAEGNRSLGLSFGL